MLFDRQQLIGMPKSEKLFLRLTFESTTFKNVISVTWTWYGVTVIVSLEYVHPFQRQVRKCLQKCLLDHM